MFPMSHPDQAMQSLRAPTWLLIVVWVVSIIRGLRILQQEFSNRYPMGVLSQFDTKVVGMTELTAISYIIINQKVTLIFANS